MCILQTCEKKKKEEEGRKKGDTLPIKGTRWCSQRL